MIDLQYVDGNCNPSITKQNFIKHWDLGQSVWLVKKWWLKVLFCVKRKNIPNGFFADAKESALEIRTNLFSFLYGSRKL